MTKNENGYPKVSGCGCSQGTPDLMGATDRMNSVRQETNRMPEGSVGENGNGNSRGGCSGTGGCGGSGNCLDEKPLAYTYAPDQKFRMLYSAKDALKHGTLFEELYKPMEVYGHEHD